MESVHRIHTIQQNLSEPSRPIRQGELKAWGNLIESYAEMLREIRRENEAVELELRMKLLRYNPLRETEKDEAIAPE